MQLKVVEKVGSGKEELMTRTSEKDDLNEFFKRFKFITVYAFVAWKEDHAILNTFTNFKTLSLTFVVFLLFF